jgi:hypothetical protein
MTRYDVRIEPMPDNPVREERGLGRRSGLYLLELWERDTKYPEQFSFVRTLEEGLPFSEAQQKRAESLNTFNGTEPPPMA